MNFEPPFISVIIPTYNEEHTIGRLLENLKKLGVEELIVADGNSADRTVEIASAYARIIRSKACRACQMNAGARASSGEVLVFLHADVRLGPGGLAAVKESLSDPDVVGGNFDIRYEGSDWVAAAFTSVNRWRRRLGVFYGDSGIFCRRKVFEGLGGYAPWPILEDYDFARRLREAGKLALLDEPIWVSDRRWRTSGLLPTLWSWFWVQGLFWAGVEPERLAGLYHPVRPMNPTSNSPSGGAAGRADAEAGCQKELAARPPILEARIPETLPRLANGAAHEAEPCESLDRLD